jgi:cell division protein FtsQ
VRAQARRRTVSASSTTYLHATSDGDEPPRRDRRRTIVIAIAAAVVIGVFLTWLVAFSSVFGVRTIEVHGTHVLTDEQVRAAADITDGTPLVRVDATAITKRVEKLAVVESAQVSTSFPSTVVITIEERVPVGYLLRSGHVRLVDHTGAEYRAVSAAPHGLPKFVVPSGSSARSTAEAVAAVAAALPAAVRKQVKSIEALDPDSITLVLTKDRLVRWGSADRTSDKARLLPALLKHHPSQVNLTDPDQPFTR